MCEPATIMAVTSVVSAGFSATQQIKQGKYQNKVAKYNARVAENEAQETRNAGTEAENAQRERTAQLLSKQRAQLGASGVDLTSGSALQLQQETNTLGNADALRIRSNTDSRVTALETSADLTHAQGANAQSAGYGNAAGTLLGGASAAMGTGVADKWFTPDSSALMSTAPLTVGVQ